MPSLLHRNIATLTPFKDNNYPFDIQSIPAPSKTTKQTIQQLDNTQKTDIEDKHQQQCSTVSISCQPQEPLMSIWEAAELGNICVVRYYLDRKTTRKDRTLLVNSQDPSTGATLLHLTITHAPTMTGNSPQDLAAAEKKVSQRLELVTLLLENGADTSTCNLYNVQAIHMVPLHIPTNTLPFLIALLEHDANVNARDGDGWTPLHYAARFCQPPTLVMQALVTHGGNVNVIDHTSKKSCLFGVIANGDHVDCFQWMIQTAKANVQLLGQFTFYPSTTSANEENDTNRIPAMMDRLQQPHCCAGPTDIMKQATLVLQAVKYGRLGILRYLIHTPKILNKLRSLISLDEMEQARHVIQHHLDGNQRNHWELIHKEVQYLFCLLEHDPQSSMAKQSRESAIGTALFPFHWTTHGRQQQVKLARKIRKFFMKPKQLIQW